MKATGTIQAGTGYWEDPNTGVTNESGFTALPAGYRLPEGPFLLIGSYSVWWSSTESGANASTRLLIYNDNGVGGLSADRLGFSVRCVELKIDSLSI